MRTFTDIEEALKEADFIASRLRRRVYIVSNGSKGVTVATNYGPEADVLEIINPPEEPETIRI